MDGRWFTGGKPDNSRAGALLADVQALLEEVKDEIAEQHKAALKEEIEAYNLLKQIIFDNEVNRFTTIVRTNFPEFYDEDRCREDRQTLGDERTELANIGRAPPFP